MGCGDLSRLFQSTARRIKVRGYPAGALTRASSGGAGAPTGAGSGNQLLASGRGLR